MNTRLAGRFVWLLSISAAFACTEANPDFSPPPTCMAGESAYLQSFALAHPGKLDLLLVVGNTPQSEALIDELAQAADEILGAVAGLDFRIAVLPATNRGRLNIPNASACPESGWVEAGDGKALDALRCLLQVPIVDAPPAAIEAVLGVQAGVLRSDARLLVLFVSLLDDCSSDRAVGLPLSNCEWQRDELSNIAQLESALRRGRNDLDATAVGLVSGPNDALRFKTGTPPSPACFGELGHALHAPRLHELVQRFETHGLAESICTFELATPLVSIIERLSKPQSATFCLGRQSSGSVQSITLVDGELRTPIDDAQHTWRIHTVTSRCATAELGVSPSPLSSGQVEVVFCGP